MSVDTIERSPVQIRPLIASRLAFSKPGSARFALPIDDVLQLSQPGIMLMPIVAEWNSYHLEFMLVSDTV